MRGWLNIRRWLSLILKYAFGILIIWWLVSTDLLDLNRLTAIELRTAVLAIALSIVALGLSAWRVQILLGVHQIHVPLWRCVTYNAVGIFYSTVLPGGMSGDAVRAYYFWRSSYTKNSSKAELVGALVTDRLIGTLIMLSIGLIAATYSVQSLGIPISYLYIAWTLFIGGLATYVLLCSIPASRWSVGGDSWRANITGKLARLIEKMDLRGYPPRVLIFAVALSVVIHVSSVLIIYIFSLSVSSGLNFGQIMSVAPVGLLVNAIPISPGGLGVGEKGFELLYRLVGGQQGGNAFMLSRIFIFAPAVFGAIVIVFSLIPRVGRRAREKQMS